jgi:hypothetical protein
MSARKPKLTDAHRLAIRLALRKQCGQALEHLDLINDTTSVWLKNAGEACDAYRGFTGYPMYDESEAR